MLTAANDKFDAGLEFELDEVGFASLHNPARFDVIVATNLYGDILSDLASGLAGGLGLAGSIMASDTHCCAQAQHGSAPDIQGKDLANPLHAYRGRRRHAGLQGICRGRSCAHRVGRAQSEYDAHYVR